LHVQHKRLDGTVADANPTTDFVNSIRRDDCEFIVEHVDDGVAIVDDQTNVIWGNKAFRTWFANAAGKPFGSLIAGPMSPTALAELFTAARAGTTSVVRFPCGEERWFDLQVYRVPSRAGLKRFAIRLHDVTAEERRRQKLAALHHAGRALNNLDADQLAEMTPAERIEVLKYNLSQFIHQLLNYDVIEIRLLDRLTGRLVPLMSEGMTEKAAALELYAKEQGNGVTGYVGATGRSYLCRDTACDEHYIEGCAGARSSLTVPLLCGDDIVGTLNIESPKANAFTEQDLQFTETFAREIAQALHTLQLLQAEKTSTASASVEAVSREIALPADEILNAATRLLFHTPSKDTEKIEQLHRIIANVRSIKSSIRAVGESVAPPKAVNAREAGYAEKLNGRRVLVVDADERIRKSAHSLLGKYGCQVETARCGQEALEMAGSGTYDAFLLDIRVPDGSAYQCYRKIRELQPDAVAIMMTGFGYDSAHSIVKARQDGLRAVLFKPFRPDQVLDALANPTPTPPQPVSIA
jgi:CheY-like chemotaxis protein